MFCLNVLVMTVKIRNTTIWYSTQSGSQVLLFFINSSLFTCILCILGYDGYQIWKAIYEENCFPEQENNIFSTLDKRCYEERVFYRSISGLHTSITTHLTSIHHKLNDQFGHNPNEYYKRFYGKL